MVYTRNGAVDTRVHQTEYWWTFLLDAMIDKSSKLLVIEGGKKPALIRFDRLEILEDHSAVSAETIKMNLAKLPTCHSISLWPSIESGVRHYKGHQLVFRAEELPSGLVRLTVTRLQIPATNRDSAFRAAQRIGEQLSSAQRKYEASSPSNDWSEHVEFSAVEFSTLKHLLGAILKAESPESRDRLMESLNGHDDEVLASILGKVSKHVRD